MFCGRDAIAVACRGDKSRAQPHRGAVDLPTTPFVRAPDRRLQPAARDLSALGDAIALPSRFVSAFSAAARVSGPVPGAHRHRVLMHGMFSERAWQWEPAICDLEWYPTMAGASCRRTTASRARPCPRSVRAGDFAVPVGSLGVARAAPARNASEPATSLCLSARWRRARGSGPSSFRTGASGAYALVGVACADRRTLHHRRAFASEGTQG